MFVIESTTDVNMAVDLTNVEIGAAANFRETINDNSMKIEGASANANGTINTDLSQINKTFQNIQTNWANVYVGNAQANANNTIGNGGIWLVTQ